jgi:hypothetical protein
MPQRIAHKGIWVEPELNAEIEYRAKSAEGKVRHPFFKGLREGPLMDDFDRFWQRANKPLADYPDPTFITRSRRYRRRGATAPRSMRPCASCKRPERRKPDFDCHLSLQKPPFAPALSP